MENPLITNARALEENKRLRRYIIDREINEALADHGCESYELAYGMISERSELLDLITGFVVRARRVPGIGLPGEGDEGALIPVSDFVYEMVVSPVFCRLFKLRDTKNPWWPGKENLSEQMKITKQNKDLASALKARADAEKTTRVAEKTTRAIAKAYRVPGH